MACQAANSDRIEMNVFVDDQTMAGPIVQHRFKPTLKQRSDPLILAVVPNAMAHVEPLHCPTQIGPRRLNLQMIMIGH
jgi:hypothetical protein